MLDETAPDTHATLAWGDGVDCGLARQIQCRVPLGSAVIHQCLIP